MTDESGEWHLVLAEYTNDFVSAGRNSVVVHQCPQWDGKTRSPIKNLPYEPLGYWTIPKHITAPCRLCGHSVPEAIANLFMLHNFDTFAGDLSDMSRIVTNQVNRTFSLMEHAFYIQGENCRCEICTEKYGEPE